MPTFGETAVGTLDYTQTLDFKHVGVTAYIAPETGTVTTMTGYVSGLGSGVGAQLVKAIIYELSGATPGALIGTSDAVSIPDGQAYSWVDFPFSTPAPVVGGHSYYLGYIGSTPSAGSQLKTFSGGGVFYNADTYSDGPSDPFGAAGSDVTHHHYSLYATYTPTLSPTGRNTTIPRTIGVNLIANGGFDTDLSGWYTANATITQDATHPLHSPYACKCVTSNAVAVEGFDHSSVHPPAVIGDLIPVTPSLVYTLSFAVYGTGTGTLRGLLDTYAYDLTYLGSATVGPFIPAVGWNVREVSKAMSADMLYVNVRFLTDVQQALTFWIDDVSLCRSDQRIRVPQDGVYFHTPGGAGGGI